MAQDQMTSSFVFYSVGYATVNKERDSRKIQALPVEAASATDGETTHNPVQEILEGIDKEGNTYQVKGTQTRDLECDWFPYEDNRATPPDIRRGELVAIYRLANTSQYFWRCMNFRNGLRTLEHVVLCYGASPNPGGSGLDFDKCYTITISPMDGHVTLKTTKANKEPYAYTAQFNTKEGWFGIADDVGNFGELNSKDTRIKLQNASQSFIKLEKDTIDLKADRYVKITVGGTTYELTPQMIEGITQVLKLNAKASATIESPQISLLATNGISRAARWDFVIG